MKHVFIVGAKGFTYGGYETFLNKLTEYHQNNKCIKYHIACKANGIGKTDETKLDGVQINSDTEYTYHNAHCFKILSPEIGSAQAIFYDFKALKYVCKYIRTNQIEEPIVYVLSSRIGFAIGYFAKEIHKYYGQYWHNPDGLEAKRKKYLPIVRLYWKISEYLMVKNADLEICDSKNIEKYIQEEYVNYNPKTTFIAYGSDIKPSKISDDNPKFVDWLNKHGLRNREYYLSVGRFVPENNFEIMIREFMRSNTTKDFAIVTTNDPKFLKQLNQKLHFRNDKRIKFVGTVYDQELLKKIRENAYAYLHGHSVGGTNPSLLEALGSTNLNLLYKVGFNKEVAEDAALYWTLEDNNLANLIDRTDRLSEKEIKLIGSKAKQRIVDAYSWQFITDEYDRIIKK